MEFAETMVGTATLPPASLEWPTIPGFVILEELGRGGMGIVYKARQETLNRLVAIKMVLPGATSEVRARFQAEAEAVARLHHPHLVAVHEVGANPAPFLVMDFVGGGTLEERLAGVPQSPASAALLVANLALAVQHAHAASVIHRDLKPSNILLAADGSPRITDFGLARLSDRTSGLTMSGAIMGTPGYMAPEQARGDNDKVGPAADVWSLGAILYQMLTGRAPYLGASALETLRQVLEVDPVPPRRLIPTIPADLETICLKCLNKDAARRYPSAGELASDLERWRNGEPILARPAGFTERVWKWIRRQPALAALYTVSALAIASMLWAAWRHNASMGVALGEVRSRAEEVRQSLVRMNTMHGLVALEGGRAANALAWFAAAHDLDPDNPLHRIRFGTARKELPDLSGLVFHEGPIRAARFSPDGSQLLTAGDDSQPGLWSIAGSSAKKLAPMPSAVSLVCFGPRAGTILLGGMDGTFRTVHPDGHASDLKAHTGAVTALEAVGESVLTAGLDGHARLWREGMAPRQWKHPGAVLAASLSATGRVATACADGKVRIFLATMDHVIVCPHPGRVLALAWNPRGDALATACADGGVRVWNDQGKFLLPVMHHRAAVMSVAFGPQGKRLVSGSDDDTACVWDGATGDRVALMRHASGVNGAMFSPDGRLVCTFGDDSAARLWWADTGESAGPWLPHTGSVAAACFAPDGKTLATASLDRTARIWKLPALVTPPNRHGWHGGTPARRWRGPGQRVLAAEGDHSARLLPDGPMLRHGSTVLYAAFNADGTRVVTGSDDNMARIWDPATGRLIGRVMPHHGSVRLACFGAEGALVATASEDGTCRVWCTESGLPVSPGWNVPLAPEKLELRGDKLILRFPGGTKKEHALVKAEGEELAAQAALLSGRRVDAMHGLLLLYADELQHLWDPRK